MSFATTSKDNWIAGAEALTGALTQIERLAGIVPRQACCDQGYRGHGHDGPTEVHVVGRMPKRAARSVRRWLKRRAAIEPTIGHLKYDHRLDRNHLKGSDGDRINVLPAAAGYNLAKLLAWIHFALKNLWLSQRFVAQLQSHYYRTHQPVTL